MKISLAIGTSLIVSGLRTNWIQRFRHRFRILFRVERTGHDITSPSGVAPDRADECAALRRFSRQGLVADGGPRPEISRQRRGFGAENGRDQVAPAWRSVIRVNSEG